MARPEGDSPILPADLHFLQRFESFELPEAEWTHLAHVRLAWICLNLGAAEDALLRIRRGILRYNTKVLERGHKYHDTVTVAFTRIIGDRMRAAERWTDFAERIGDILDPGRPVLLRYYSASRLYSDEARRRFIEPDREDLPELRDGKEQAGCASG